MTLKLWFKWRVLPYFKREDEIWGKIGTESYKLSVYRWESWVSPTIWQIRHRHDTVLKIRE